MAVYRVRWTETAVELLERISDRRIRRMLYERAGQLDHDPEKQGKPLLGELSGFRSLKVAGRRYRIICHIEADEVVVSVVAVGLRKDGDRHGVYALAQKLLKQGLLSAASTPPRSRRRGS
jgi:mRNA interferase RelE/StbE